MAPDAKAAAAAAAAAMAGSEQQRPWSKHSVGSSRHQQAGAAADKQAAAGSGTITGKGRKRGAGSLVEEAAAADPQLAEFLELMQPRAKGKIWSNDELVLPSAKGTGVASATAAVVAAAAMAGRLGRGWRVLWVLDGGR